MTESATGGIRPVSIEGRVARERERLIGMTEEERAWRAKYLKSLHLSHGEPVMTPEMYRQYYNPLRRLYKAPLNVFEKAITPIVGNKCAYVVRGVIGKLTLGAILVYASWYQLKYNHATWQRVSGWTMMQSRSTVLPGEPGYPKVAIRPPNQYASKEFEKAPI
ncbi:NADH dehydrogenase (ubiquinone) B17 subunit [Augochlora pura]